MVEAPPEVVERVIDIRWRDIDAYGHVNNAVYQTYLEEGRDFALRHLLRELPDPFDHVLARVAIDFRRELNLADRQVVVGCAVVAIGTSSIRTRETIRTPADQVAAEAEAVIVAIDRDTRRPRALTDPERRVLTAAGARPRERSRDEHDPREATKG